MEDVKDMNRTTKEMISEYLTDQTEKFDLVHADAFTTVTISDNLHISRTIASQYLNELVESGEVFKVKSRPVYFFDAQVLNRRFGLKIQDCDFVDLEEMGEYLRNNGQMTDIFAQMIGHEGSLRRIIRRCTEVFNYPPSGLAFAICGNEGTGKRTLAGLICRHSMMSNGIVGKSDRIIERDLSVNDPFLTEKIGTFLDEHCRESMTVILSHFETVSESLISYLVRFFEKGLNSNVHFIFLSEKRPDDFLPSTFARFVPVAVRLKDFHERPKEEREGIVLELFRREAAELHVHMSICSNVLRVLANARYAGNIEDLSKTVKLICAQAINGQNGSDVKIHTFYLPEEMLETIELSYENITYIDCDTSLSNRTVDQLEDFFAGTLKACSARDIGSMNDQFRSVYEMIVETIMTQSRNDQTLNGTEAAVGMIVRRVAEKHFINIPGTFSFVIAKLMNACNEYEIRISRWNDANRDDVTAAREKAERVYVSESLIVDEICMLAMKNLEEQIPDMIRIIMILTIASCNADLNKNRTFGVIICHGYSTASSIAGAVNSLIGSYVFDSIDMPVMTTMDEIRATLRQKLSRINPHADICIMVDMGSLEKIADDEFTRNRNVAIINNVSTKMALDIGYKIRNGISMDQYFVNAERDYRVEYRVLKGKKKDVILFTSESGLQTAQRMASLFGDSLPVDVPVSLQAVMFESLMEDIEQIQSSSNVLFITGTDNPGIRNVSFIPLEDIVTTTNLDLVSSRLNGYLDEANLRQLIINIRTNFSLMNVLNYLTILNPKPLMDATTIAVDDLQKRRGLELEGRTLVGLYIHICILVERLVTKTGVIREDSATDTFVKNHQDFIKDIRASFRNIEKHYSITIPDPEMKYIYSFINKEEKV